MTPGEFLTEAVVRRYSRREVVKRALALGFSAPVITMLLAACGAGDEGDEDSKEMGGDANSTAAAAQGDSPDPAATTAADSNAGDGDVEETPAGDGETTPTSGDSGSLEGNADAKGSIVISLADEPLTLENWNGYSKWAHPILRNVMEALTNRDPETNELIPELALSWERTDEITWRFVLREGVTFHNGDALNADLAAYGLNYTWDADNGFDILSMMGPQITATAIDEYTLDVTTDEPDPILPTRLYFSPLPSMAQLEQDPESAKDDPIGTGPYTFVEWAKGQYIRLTANPDWWGHDGNDPYGQVAIMDAEFQFRIESTVRAAQITTDEAHLTHVLSPEDCEVVPVCKSAPSVETLILRLDTMNPTLQDVRIRQAIAYAIDIQAVTAQIFAGSAPATQIYGPATVGYNHDLEPYPYDMDRAKSLVEEAASEGVSVDKQFTIVTTGTASGSMEFVQYLAEQLSQIGLRAETQVMEAAQYRPAVYGTPREQVSPERGWLVLVQHGNELMDASASMNYFRCDAETQSTFCNEEIEPRIHESFELEGDERDLALQEVASQLYDTYGIIPIAHLNINYGMVEEVNWAPRLDGFMLLKEMSFS